VFWGQVEITQKALKIRKKRKKEIQHFLYKLWFYLAIFAFNFLRC
jgi:hypothetical protein